MEDKTFDNFRRIFNQATREASLAAYREIARLHKGISDPEKTDFKAIGRILDQAGVSAMQKVFERQSFFYIEIKGSEGRKDTKRDGIESADLYGSYGNKDGSLVEVVNDAVEGTKFASRNEPCATSVLAAVLESKNGILATGNFDYMNKLFGPPPLLGKLSLDFSPEENYKIALKELKIKNPKDLGVVILDRIRNSLEIESAQDLGLTTILINGGDLTPCILAAADPKFLRRSKRLGKNVKALLVIGSGGWEEGVIAAAAAKALGGFVQGRAYSETKEEIEQARILGADDLVPAQRDTILVSLSLITDDPWFNIPGVKADKVNTISITNSTLEIISE
jgi:fructose-1,6-bisphosphatase/sedoheptulose 1,7-bisphosphatase-like protein